MLKWKKGEEPLNKKTKYTVAMIHIDTAQKQLIITHLKEGKSIKIAIFLE